MAFNPFTWFRKHQKMLIAVTTIFVMFIFILQFGQGDAFQRMLGVFGAARAQGQVVTTLNGSKIREGDLDNVRRRRKLASNFMFRQAWDSVPRLLMDLLNTDLKTEAKDSPLIGLKALVERAQRRGNIPLRDMEQFLGRLPPQFLRQFVVEQTQRELAAINSDLQLLDDLARKPEVRKDPENLRLLDKIGTALGFQSWAWQHIDAARNLGLTFGQAMPEDLYFGGGYKRIDDLLDFLVWKHQADRLGITLTDKDVMKEINRDAAGQQLFDPDTRFERAKKVDDFLHREKETPRELLDALRDEFRASMAQGMLVGVEPGVREYRRLFGAATSPAVGTPGEFYNFYRDQRTTVSVRMLAVPVEKFLDQVKDKPTESELRARFGTFKDKEPSPFSRDPGFKEPRRILVEAVAGSPWDPFYRDQARKQVEAWKRYSDSAVLAVNRFGAGFHLLPGAPFAGTVLSRLMPLAFDPLGQPYEDYLKKWKEGFGEPSLLQEPWLSPLTDDRTDLEKRAGRFHLSSLITPMNTAAVPDARLGAANVAAALGVLSGWAGRAAAPLASLNSLYATATYYEVRTSLRLVLSQPPAVALGNPLGAAAMAVRLQPDVPTRQQLEPMLLASLQDSLAGSLLEQNLSTIRTELQKFRGKPRGGDEYVKKAAKEYHLTFQSMREPLPLETMVEKVEKKQDLGIGALLDALKEGQGPRSRPQVYVEQLFVQPMGQSPGAYQAQQIPATEKRKQEVLWWRSEDLPARQRTFEQARELVVRAWKLDRARELARERAYQIEAEINKQKRSPADAVRFLREQEAGLGPLFELEGVAPLVVPQREVHMAVRGDYFNYRVPEDKLTLMPYPPQDLARQLLTLEEKGRATVVADQPARTFYVAVLEARDEPNARAFAELYARTPRYDTLYNLFLRERTEDYRRGVLEQLRREAGKVDKQGRFEVPAEIRKRDAGETREVEE
jgi:hypothetical protein